jgi:hypothetical protein
MTLQMDAESPTQQIARLTRELAHVGEQCRLAHRMAMDWRQRALTAEEQSRRLQRKYYNLKRRKGLEHESDEPDEDLDWDEALSLSALL